MSRLSSPATRGAAAVSAALLAVTLATLPSSGSPGTPQALSGAEAADSGAFRSWGDSPLGLANVDARGTALPTALQRRAADALGSDVSVRWNEMGTPASVFAADGDLGSLGGADAAAGARAWLLANAAVLGIDAAQVQRLELVNEQRLAGSDARAVLFRQRFGDLTPALGSMVTVGVADGKVVYVSSSLTRTTATPAAADLSPTQAWRLAARSVGREVATDDLSEVVERDGWTRFQVAGFAQEQLSRLRALALADGSVRPVFETNVVDVQGGASSAYTLMVDAVSGKVLHRENQVEHFSNASLAAAPKAPTSTPFSGEVDGARCGARHPFQITDGDTRSVSVVATAAVAANDITVKILTPGGEVAAAGDLLTSPEALTWAPEGRIPAGTYSVEVCPFEGQAFAGSEAYVGAVSTSTQEVPEAGLPFPPVWSYFLANPALEGSAGAGKDTRVTGCWRATDDECDQPPGSLENLAARAPWDHDFTTGLPTLTTVGNAANTHEAWVSPLTPGGLLQAPVSAERRYTPAFTDAWSKSKCDPAQLVPGGNDIEAAVGHLFASHNRMHDYSYYLGFTEANYNMQSKNLGNNPDPTRENDPEIGNAQAGAITGGNPTYLGRDNANQISLQDGVPGITNQYLFQPIAGAFYSPCADGTFDMSIIGHEYTHAISNRMIGGPDEGITSDQGGAMGESWSDLVAQEYLFSHGYSTGSDNPWAVGPYATGNKQQGIRNYSMSTSPLTYGEVGYDQSGPQVHADGEIWSATQFQVRQALVDRWNSRFPYSDKGLQRRCAEGTATSSPLPATQCPGNRRWVQLMFDSFLLQQGATSMLDARDAMLAADQMRFRGENTAAMWRAFARKGMGSDASTPSPDSSEPIPGYQAPGTPSATVRIATTVGGVATPADVHVGTYEARTTPSADTDPATPLGSTLRLAPGTYDLLVVGQGVGHTRTRITVAAGQQVTRTIALKRNVASLASGARVTGASPGSLTPQGLVDDTESTSWAGVNETENVDEVNPFVTVDLAGGARTIRSVRASAMLRPADETDALAGSRFTALRTFAIETCLQSAEVSCSGDDVAWKRVYTSSADAFPAVRPRPSAPQLQLREFAVPATRATHVRFVALENQCTGFSGYAGEQDNDPNNPTDCASGTTRGTSVRAAELQVFE